MARSGFSFANLANFQSMLSAINPLNNAQDSVSNAAEMLRADIQSRAPVDTGFLASSYQVDVESTGSGARARIYSEADYAIHQEYGTRYQSGTAHLRPAIDANRQAILDMMGADALQTTFNQAR